MAILTEQLFREIVSSLERLLEYGDRWLKPTTWFYQGNPDVARRIACGLFFADALSRCNLSKKQRANLDDVVRRMAHQAALAGVITGEPLERLQTVAHLSDVARAWCYSVVRDASPGDPVRVEEGRRARLRQLEEVEARAADLAAQQRERDAVPAQIEELHKRAAALRAEAV
jgi:hypothetical protein